MVGRKIKLLSTFFTCSLVLPMRHVSLGDCGVVDGNESITLSPSVRANLKNETNWLKKRQRSFAPWLMVRGITCKQYFASGCPSFACLFASDVHGRLRVCALPNKIDSRTRSGFKPINRHYLWSLKNTQRPAHTVQWRVFDPSLRVWGTLIRSQPSVHFFFSRK